MHHGELREPTFLILAAIAAQPQHGYGIKRSIAEVSDGRFEVGTGTVYSALDRLVADGLVSDAGTEIVKGRHRRYFALTESGAELLEAAVRRLTTNAEHAAEQLRVRQVTSRTSALRGPEIKSNSAHSVRSV